LGPLSTFVDGMVCLLLPLLFFHQLEVSSQLNHLSIALLNQFKIKQFANIKNSFEEKMN
jgi:hypothetical protein